MYGLVENGLPLRDCDSPQYISLYLVGGIPTPLKNDWSSSVGMMKFPTEWKVTKFMFKSTNQKL
jgi:hypothetical protein